MVDRIHNVFARQSAVVRPVGHRGVHFGGDYNVVAAGVFEQRAANNLFCYAMKITVGGVEIGDAEVECAFEVGPLFRLVHDRVSLTLRACDILEGH